MKRPAAVYILIALHLFLGVCGIAGGALLMIRPDGYLLGMEEGWLAHAPFSDYFIPGVLLFCCNGLLPFLVLFGLTRNRKRRAIFNIYRDRHWGWTFSLYSGIITIGWIVIQQMMTQYFWIQPLIAGIGLLIIIFTMMPGLMRYFEIPSENK